MSAVQLGAVFGVGALLGGLVVRGLPTPEPVVAPVVRTVERSAPRVVCTDVAVPPAAEVEDLSARLAWCEGRLRAATAPRPTGRIAWPEGIPDTEAPDAWTGAMDAVVEDCGVPGQPVVTDCEEYPCVTLLRPDGPAVSGQALRDQLRACPELQARMGEFQVEAAPLEVHCPDGRVEEALVVSGFTEEGAEAVYGPGEIAFEQYIVHAGRRVESALQLWACEEAP